MYMCILHTKFINKHKLRVIRTRSKDEKNAKSFKSKKHNLTNYTNQRNKQTCKRVMFGNGSTNHIMIESA